MWSDYRLAFGTSAVLAALITSVINFFQGDTAFAALLLVLSGLGAGLLYWLTRPDRSGLHINHAEAQAGAGDGDVILYWRPG